MSHLLIVDDEESICWGLAQLAGQLGHTTATAASAEQGLDLARRKAPDAVVLDVRLPGMDGLAAMRRFYEELGSVPIIVMTAYGDLETAVTAVRNGAVDYLTKPFDLGTVRRSIERALHLTEQPPSAPADESSEEHERIVGRSAAMQEVFKRIALVAPSEACVHVFGESGTGKELVARAIHRFSRRASGPFVPVNVASLSPSLAESELFGHARGAFTGADEARVGRLQQADGGTVFLDEVADIPMPLQVKLLRALEHREVFPVGQNRPVEADFRIVSATHQNLAERVAEGRFRHDLYFRLVTFNIEIAPLRERPDDIPELAGHFLNLLSARTGRPAPSIEPDMIARLQRLPWYGNVRELRNAVEHATILAQGGRILPEHLPPPAPPTMRGHRSPADAIVSAVRRWTELQLRGGEGTDLYNELLGLVEPPLLRATFEHYRGQYAAAARRLGLHRTTLRKKLERDHPSTEADSDEGRPT